MMDELKNAYEQMKAERDYYIRLMNSCDEPADMRKFYAGKAVGLDDGIKKLSAILAAN